MYQNCCKKCGSISLHTETNGNNVGLYCDDCGAWIKWLGKDELRAFEHGMREATKEERDSVNRYIESISKPTGNTFTSTMKDRLERFVEGIDEAMKELQESYKDAFVNSEDKPKPQFSSSIRSKSDTLSDSEYLQSKYKNNPYFKG